MYPKSLVFALTLLSCLFLMASAAPVIDGRVKPVKRLKQYQMKRDDDSTLDRLNGRDYPSYPGSSPVPQRRKDIRAIDA